MTARSLPGFDDGEPTLEVWEVRTGTSYSTRWYANFFRKKDGWYWIDYATSTDSHGPFPTRDLALADAARCGADVREENVV